MLLPWTKSDLRLRAIQVEVLCQLEKRFISIEWQGMCKQIGSQDAFRCVVEGSLNRLPPGRFGGCFYACTLQSPMAILKAMERSMMDKRNSKSTLSKHRKILKNPRNLSQQRWHKIMCFCALNWGDSRHLGSTKRNVERYPLLCDGRVPGWVVVMEMG